MVPVYAVAQRKNFLVMTPGVFFLIVAYFEKVKLIYVKI